MMYGIDISSYQRGLNLKNTGASFVICKATDGNRFVDRYCDGFIQEAKRNGQLWGFYHFANSPNKCSMKEQARYFVNNCKNYFGYGLPVLDWEDSKEEYGGAVIKWGPSYAKQWLDEVYRLTGVKPMIYMSASVAKSYDWSEVAKDYALWGAGYTGIGTYKNPGTDFYNWGAWGWPAIHQYSSSNGLDKNIGYLDSNAWNKFVKGSGTVSTPSAPSSTSGGKSISTLATEVLAGKWGNGNDRKAKLQAAGYDYNAVQAEVNRRAGAVPVRKSNAEVAKEVVAGKWGNGNARKEKLKAAGYNFDSVQAEVNKLMGCNVKSNDQIAKEVIRGVWGNGEARRKALRSAGYNPDTIQSIVNKML